MVAQGAKAQGLTCPDSADWDETLRGGVWKNSALTFLHCFHHFFALKISVISRANIVHLAPRQVDDHQMALWELNGVVILGDIYLDEIREFQTSTRFEYSGKELLSCVGFKSCGNS